MWQKKVLPLNNRYLSLLVFSLLLSGLSQASCENITLSTPNSRLIDNGDNTITDMATTLMWKQCSEGQANDGTCSGSASDHTWQSALQIPQALNTGGGFAGHSDWRLPNIKELRSIVEVACQGPAINEIRFPNTSARNYWSSTLSVDNTSNAWRVEFDKGETSASRSARSSLYLVRLVRDDS